MTEERRRPDEHLPEGDSTGGVIPYKNPKALIAYYCGIFALLPCIGIAPGIAGLVLGIMGLRYRAAHPETKGSVHAWIGIILGGGMSLIWLALFLIGFVGAASGW